MAGPSTLFWRHQDSSSNISMWHLLPGLVLLTPWWPCWMLPLLRTSMCSKQLRISQAIKDVQVSSLPPDLKADCLEHVVIDFGWQRDISGKPVDAWPLGTLGTEEPLAWVKLSKADCYSAFGKLGRGMGAYTARARYKTMAHLKAWQSYKQKLIAVHGCIFWRPKACPTHCEQECLGATF